MVYSISQTGAAPFTAPEGAAVAALKSVLNDYKGRIIYTFGRCNDGGQLKEYEIVYNDNGEQKFFRIYAAC